MHIFQTKTYGFTLVEMLIAVAIIGTLTVATVPHVSGLQARARDLVRVMHMRDIGHAIEAYAIEQNTYPSSSYTDTTALTPLLHNYLTSMPTDPNDMGISNTQGSCTLQGSGYSYFSTSTGYALTAIKESNKGNTDTCRGVINRKSDGPYQVSGKGLVNLLDNKHYNAYPPPSQWTEAGCFTIAGSKIVSYKSDPQCPKDVIIPWYINGIEITEIGQSAFSRKNITSVRFPNSITSIDNYAFLGNYLDKVTLPPNLTHIGQAAFYGNKIAEITIPNSVQSIHKSVFRGVPLTVNFEEGRTIIPRGMFQDNGVHTVHLPQSLQSIDIYAFLRNNISQLTLPPNLTHIGQAAFYGNKIAEITIPNSVQSIHKSAFRGVPLTVNFEEGRTIIPRGMFQDNNIHTVHLPQSLQSIDIYAFLHNNISQLTLPPNLTHIGQAAFYGNKIAEVSFPNHFQARTAHPNAFERNGPNSTSKRIPESTGTWILQDDQWVRP